MNDAEAASSSSETSEQPSSGSASEDEEEPSLKTEQRTPGADKKKKKKKKARSLQLRQPFVPSNMICMLTVFGGTQKKKSDGSSTVQPAVTAEEKAESDRQRAEADKRQAVMCLYQHMYEESLLSSQ